MTEWDALPLPATPTGTPTPPGQILYYIGLAQIKPPAIPKSRRNARALVTQSARQPNSLSLYLSLSRSLFLFPTLCLSVSVCLSFAVRGRAKGLGPALGRTQDTSDAALAHSSSLARRLFFPSCCTPHPLSSFHSDLVSCSTNAKKKFFFDILPLLSPPLPIAIVVLGPRC